MIEAKANTVDLEKLLGDMAEKAGDLTSVWPKVGQWWKARQTTVFMTGNRGAWGVRDKDTAKIGPRLMVRTGLLMRTASNPKPLYASPTTARFGMQSGGDAYYGLFHQRGSGVPKREVVPGLQPNEVDEIVDIIRDHIMAAAR